MRKIIFILFVALMTAVSTQAQQISVVSPNGTTSLHRTLQEAIEKAVGGSVIYLPGGGFTISDEVKITKKLTIIGIGHKSDNDNADGVTTITGNLWFDEGSSGSAVMACYITGNVNIGNDGSSVNDVLIRYCNLNSVQVNNSTCQETIVNQNYLRGSCNFGNSNVRLENNIVHSMQNINGGKINHNVITDAIYVKWGNYSYSYYPLLDVSSSSILNNFILSWQSGHSGNNCQASYNCIGTDSWGDNPVVLDENTTWEDVFEHYDASNKFSIKSKYDLKGKWGIKQASDGTDIGIYGGSGFNLDQMAPVPYITFKNIPDQTDSSGHLNIQIRVKAGK